MDSFFRLFSGVCLVLMLLSLPSCFRPKDVPGDERMKAPGGESRPVTEEWPKDEGGGGMVMKKTANNDGEIPNADASRLPIVMRKAELPDALYGTIQAAFRDDPGFIVSLLLCLDGDPSLRELIDKQHPLSAGYAPGDLVTLSGGDYRVNRAGMTLRRPAVTALEEMAAAARADGVTLLVSSTYRSHDYQIEVYNRNVRELGQEAADRESARPGFSQHQSGLVVDFGSVDDSFAQTAAGRWMAANASRFGWSLSFPDGYEAVTGYRWESWHFRYVGKELAAFIDNYFDGIQQYALRFLHEWELF